MPGGNGFRNESNAFPITDRIVSHPGRLTADLPQRADLRGILKLAHLSAPNLDQSVSGFAENRIFPLKVKARRTNPTDATATGRNHNLASASVKPPHPRDSGLSARPSDPCIKSDEPKRKNAPSSKGQRLRFEKLIDGFLVGQRKRGFHLLSGQMRRKEFNEVKHVATKKRASTATDHGH